MFDSLGRDLKPGQVISYASAHGSYVFTKVGVVREVTEDYIKGDQPKEYSDGVVRFGPFTWQCHDRATILNIDEAELIRLKGVQNEGHV